MTELCRSHSMTEHAFSRLENHFAMKNASTIANLILKHPQRIARRGTFYKVCSIYCWIALCRAKHRNQSAGVDVSQSTVSQNTISGLLYILEIFSVGMMPSATSNKTDIFPFTLVRKFHIKQFNNCTRNVICILKYPYRLTFGKLS